MLNMYLEKNMQKDTLNIAALSQTLFGAFFSNFYFWFYSPVDL